MLYLLAASRSSSYVHFHTKYPKISTVFVPLQAHFMLYLLAGEALLRSGRVDSAEYVFKRLVNRVSDGDCTFGELAGIHACSVRLEAIGCVLSLSILHTVVGC